MKNRCPSCGRDCFNPVECTRITDNMNAQENVRLVLRIEALENQLRLYGIPLPGEEKQPETPTNFQYDPNDDLPF